MKNIIAVSTNSFHGFDVMDALETIAKAGFKYVEICAVRNWTEHVMPDMSAEKLEAVKQKMKELGLKCISMSGHCDLSDASRLNDFRANMKLAADLGCEWIISSTGEAHFGSEDVSDIEALLTKNIKTLVPDLEKLGLKLGIEVHGPNYGTGEACARLVDGVGAFPTVGVNFDTANVVYWGQGDPDADIKTCAKKINYCHLKDKIGVDGEAKKEWNFPAIGAGELHLLDLISYMNENGYEGPLSIELEYNEAFTMRDKVDGDLDFAYKTLKESYDYLHANGLI